MRRQATFLESGSEAFLQHWKTLLEKRNVAAFQLWRFCQTFVSELHKGAAKEQQHKKLDLQKYFADPICRHSQGMEGSKTA